MQLQLQSLAAIASAVVVSADNLRLTNKNISERSLQDSLTCMLVGGDFTSCCPAANPNDGICTLLWCVNLDEVAVNDGCACGQIETACGQVAAFASAVEGLGAMCEQVDTCCDAGTTANGGFNSCMGKAVEDGVVSVPDFGSLIPGGIPDLGTVVMSTVAVATTVIEVAATTEAPATEAPAEQDGCVAQIMRSTLGSGEPFDKS